MTMRNSYLPPADVLLILAAAVSSFVLRFETLLLWTYSQPLFLFTALVVLVRPPLFYVFGLYRQVWHYASVREALLIAAATAVGSSVLTIVVLGVALPFELVLFFPRSVIVIEGVLVLLLVGGLRFAVRAFGGAAKVRSDLHRLAKEPKKVLVVGAGDAGAMVVREMRAKPELGLLPVGFVDDDVAKKGMWISGVRILGTRDDIPAIVDEREVDEVIIAIPTAPGKAIREIIAVCRSVGVAFRTVPGLFEIIDGTVRVSQLREVRLEDLLRREPVRVDLGELGTFLSSKTVLVTGAGGSIGSELCRQIARFQPQRLILFELSEGNLFQIHHELTARFPTLHITPVVGDIRDQAKVSATFSELEPKVVFHAAAYKHVPLMESNVEEVVANNVFGTRNIIEASLQHAIECFVLISTDKAVNPKSVMGASKRVAELLTLEASRRSSGVFVSVRFGNVLGSSGSAVPLFKEQIATGGPVTVTHPEVQRYFMTLPEAVSLIIQAAAMGKGEEIFVLDMGQPIKIKDLVSDLVRLSGLEPEKDIDVVFTGLRAGEKLREELFTAQEQLQRTRHSQIFAALSNRHDNEELQRDLAKLESLVKARDTTSIKAQLKRIVPEYESEAQS